jgi:hypothetical protein
MHIEGVLFDLGRRSDRRIIAKLERPCGTEVEIAGITEDEMMTLSSNMFDWNPRRFTYAARSRRSASVNFSASVRASLQVLGA